MSQQGGPASSSTSAPAAKKPKLSTNEGLVILNKPNHGFMPNISISEMRMNHQYKVYSARRQPTKYGDKIILLLKDHQMFLPSSYKTMTDEVIESFCTGTLAICKAGEYNSPKYQLKFFDDMDNEPEFNDAGDDDEEEEEEEEDWDKDDQNIKNNLNK